MPASNNIGAKLRNIDLQRCTTTQPIFLSFFKMLTYQPKMSKATDHLTSCLSKLAERMIKNQLYWWLESNKILNPNKAGFRTGQQTEDQLLRLSHKVIDGFQKKKNTTAVFVDL
ncbi:RNA-directed DNA polymerase from [Elysia marginata]|uniref:RNA-directed DNA polymerase from n=1 Tax=Elysia marginata TaxID=1093978 RepID=A0AAV4JRQ6_9GAST|nr:RNA-directed DNA polymerase from [Elysia marginata]